MNVFMDHFRVFVQNRVLQLDDLDFPKLTLPTGATIFRRRPSLWHYFTIVWRIEQLTRQYGLLLFTRDNREAVEMIYKWLFVSSFFRPSLFQQTTPPVRL